MKRIRNKTRLQKKSRRTPYTQQQSRAEQSKERGQSRAEFTEQQQMCRHFVDMCRQSQRTELTQYSIKVTVSFSNKKTWIKYVLYFQKLFKKISRRPQRSNLHDAINQLVLYDYSRLHNNTSNRRSAVQCYRARPLCAFPVSEKSWEREANEVEELLTIKRRYVYNIISGYFYFSFN